MTAQLALRLDAPDPRAYVLDAVESLARVRVLRGGAQRADEGDAMTREATPLDVIEGRARWAVVCGERDEVLASLGDAVKATPG
jgi:hypothetical protein